MHRMLTRGMPLAKCLRSYATSVKMPSLSPTMTEGTIVSWTVKEGESIAPGDVICEIQTDKAVVSLEYDEEGVMAKIIAAAGSAEVQVGAPIAMVADVDEDWQTVVVPESSSTPTPPPPAQAVSSQPAAAVVLPGTQHRVVSPAARLLMMLYDIDASKVTAGGPKGALTKSDVADFINVHKLTATKQEAHSSMPDVKETSKSSSTRPMPVVKGAQYDDVEATSMRKTIAKRLTLCKQQVPHEYLTLDVTLDAALALRQRCKTDGTPCTLNDILIKAVATALTSVPHVNVQYTDDTVRPQSTVDISIAVATKDGLITPIVKNANHRGISDIGRTVRELAGRAKENRLKLDEFQGGTFTISNLGMMGISSFTGIINPPQCAILCVGTTRSTMVDAPTSAVDPQVACAPARWNNVMSLTLCYDGRAIEGPTAARFMSELRAFLETPDTMIGGVADVRVEDDDFDIARLL